MTGPDIGSALEWIRTQLDGAGVRASSDPAKVNPPGAWLDATLAEPINLGDAWRISANVVLVAPDGAPAAAWRHLDQLVAKTATVLTLVEPIEVVTLQLPGSAAKLPALIYPVQVFTP